MALAVDSLGLAEVGVELTERGTIAVDEVRVLRRVMAGVASKLYVVDSCLTRDVFAEACVG